MKNYQITPYREIRQRVVNKEESLTDFARALLDKIYQRKDLNAFAEVFHENVMNQAGKVDKKIREGYHGKLAGAFIAVKDNILIKGRQSAASSRTLEDFTAPVNAKVIDNLLREDVIIIGRTNCDEFAMGSSNERSVYGSVKHPIDERRIPGGSSGGSAVAVSTGLCHAALGTDTGGSVRQPAAYCGVWGMKPAYGSVSRYGAIAYAPSFEQIGPIACDVCTLQKVLEVLEGIDDRETVTAKEQWQQKEDKSPQLVFLNFDKKAKLWYEQKKYIAEKAGHDNAEERNIQWEDKLLPVYHTLTMVEASSSMARYQNYFFGKNKISESEVYSYRTKYAGQEVQRKILAGIALTVSKPKRYENALLWRRKFSNYFEKLFNEFDIIVTPATSAEALKKSEYDTFIDLYDDDKFLIPANITGIVALVFPLGITPEGLPLSIQLMGKKNHEKLLINFADNLSKDSSKLMTIG